MIRQTIEQLFEENHDEITILDGIFKAIRYLIEGLHVSPDELTQVIFEIQERKKIGNGIIAARLMELLRYLRTLKPYPSGINESSIYDY